MRRLRTALSVALLALGTAGLLAPEQGVSAQVETVYLVEVYDTIDLGLAPYVKRVIDEATEAGAAGVILEVNTPGGRLDAALQIKNAILDSKVPVTAFINREAFSAGALIAIAAHNIYMAPGAVMGAATPVDQEGEQASEKVVSGVRKDFKAVAEVRGRNPLVAEAMVDEAVAVEGLVEEGKLLTLSTQEALEWGYAEGEVEDLPALLEALDLKGAQLIETSPSFAENLVRFLTHPIVASLLLSLGALGLLVEVTSSGFGVPGLAGATLLALFFWGHFLAGLAGWEGVALVVVGLALIGVEVFLIPGFGVAGVLGIAAFLGGIFLSLIGEGAAGEDFMRAGLMMLASVGLVVVGGWAAMAYLPKGKPWRGLGLPATLPAGPGIEPPAAPSRRRRRGAAARRGEPQPGALEGARGVAITDLHPAGVANIDGRRVDVVTEGGYIASGTHIEIIADEGYRRVVRAVSDADPSAASGNL